MAKDNGGPVFPCEYNMDSTDGQTKPVEGFYGMSLRDWYAGLAMQAIITASGNHNGDGVFYGERNVANSAFTMANAMLAERKKK